MSLLAAAPEARYEHAYQLPANPGVLQVITVTVNDFVIPEAKASIVDASEKEVKAIERQFESGLVTKGERYNKVIDIWSRANEQVAKQ